MILLNIPLESTLKISSIISNELNPLLKSKSKSNLEGNQKKKKKRRNNQIIKLKLEKKLFPLRILKLN